MNQRPKSWINIQVCRENKLSRSQLKIHGNAFEDPPPKKKNNNNNLCYKIDRLMPSSHCTILDRFFTRWQVLINHDKWPKSEENSFMRVTITARSLNYQGRNLRESPMRRWHPWNICHAKYLELSAIHNPTVWMSFDWKNTSVMTYSQWESKIQGSGKFGEEFILQSD